MGGFNNFNKITVVGRMVKEPTTRSFGGDGKVCNFSVATNDRVKKDGEWVSEVSYFDCSAFGKLGDFVSEHATKGREVLVDGRFRQESYVAKDGSPRTKLCINVNEVVFLGSKDKNDAAQGGGDVNSRTAPSATFKAEEELLWDTK